MSCGDNRAFCSCDIGVRDEEGGEQTLRGESGDRDEVVG